MKAIITLQDESPAKVQIDNRGVQRTVFMEMQELASYIVSSVKNESVEYEEKPKLVMASPTLPPNTAKYARLSDGTDILFLFHPETKANITYHKSEFKDVPFPNLVFCFGVRNEQLVTKTVFAYKDRFLRDETELYRFPFANVFDGGKLCYFDNTPIKDLVQLQTFAYTWLNAPFNDHLYNQERCTTLNKPLREIFDTSQGKKFNYDMLVPLNMTFNSLSQGLLS